MINKDLILENFKVASLDMIILKLLSEKDIYGWEFEEKISELSRGHIRVKTISIYGKLHTLHKKGFITSSKIKAGKKRFRVYYSITELGKQYLEVATALYTEYQTGMYYIMFDKKEYYE